MKHDVLILGSNRGSGLGRIRVGLELGFRAVLYETRCKLGLKRRVLLSFQVSSDSNQGFSFYRANNTPNTHTHAHTDTHTTHKHHDKKSLQYPRQRR